MANNVVDTGRSGEHGVEPTVICPRPFLSRSSMGSFWAASPDEAEGLDFSRIQISMAGQNKLSDHHVAFAGVLDGSGTPQNMAIELPCHMFLPLHPVFSAVMVEQWVNHMGVLDWPADRYYFETFDSPLYSKDNWIKVWSGASEPPDAVGGPDPLQVRGYNSLHRFREGHPNQWWCRSVSLRNYTGDVRMARALGVDITSSCHLTPEMGQLTVGADVNTPTNAGKTVLVCVQAVYAGESFFDVFFFATGGQNLENDWVEPPTPGSLTVLPFHITPPHMTTGWQQLMYSPYEGIFRPWVGLWFRPHWHNMYGIARQFGNFSFPATGSSLQILNIAGSFATVRVHFLAVVGGYVGQSKVLRWQNPTPPADAELVASGGLFPNEILVPLLPGENRLAGFAELEHNVAQPEKVVQLQRVARLNQPLVPYTYIRPHDAPDTMLDPTYAFVSAVLGP